MKCIHKEGVMLKTLSHITEDQIHFSFRCVNVSTKNQVLSVLPTLHLKLGTVHEVLLGVWINAAQTLLKYC